MIHEIAGKNTAGEDLGERSAATSVLGYQAEPSRRGTVYQLAAAMILASLFSATPAVSDIAEHLRSVDSPGVARWACLLLLAAIIQFSYTIYMVQLPDWSTVWVVSLTTLFFAFIYAMLVAVLIMGQPQSHIVQLLGLQDQLHGNRAAGWCAIMVSLTSLLAYAAGRISVRWHQACQILASSGSLTQRKPAQRSLQ
jgi:hypothetical protein